ncbi:hypothetical protein B1756_16600 [Natrarchaeobaculum aegyptiacum]|uniref:Transposase n=1 Tax=Natrarchaeobaculum aegyptiacum TaxID=745377 RepID=A0A2Z2HV59_9EURY|nr:hypothetical protein B1756_16600 [Natrarchaeobaculum aegyptiacum]
MERERMPRKVTVLGVPLHLGVRSLSYTVRELERRSVGRSHKAVHDWVHTADLGPTSGASPDTVALEETVFWIHGQQHWPDETVGPETNEIPYVRCIRPEWRN